MGMYSAQTDKGRTSSVILDGHRVGLGRAEEKGVYDSMPVGNSNYNPVLRTV